VRDLESLVYVHACVLVQCLHCLALCSYAYMAGYGQRAKQQLLLDPLLDNDPARPNKLANTLVVGITAVLIDLFLLDDGPGLRGKLAHGELDLSSAYTDGITAATAGAATGAAAGAATSAGAGTAATAAAGVELTAAGSSTADSVYNAPAVAVLQQCGSDAAQSSTSTSSDSSSGVENDSRDSLQLLAVVFIALLWRYTPRAAPLCTAATTAETEAAAAIAACEQCAEFCDSYRTHFHPHTMIEVSTSQCIQRSALLLQLPVQCTLWRLAPVAKRYDIRCDTVLLRILLNPRLHR
jgi:hypothetical protein